MTILVTTGTIFVLSTNMKEEFLTANIKVNEQDQQVDDNILKQNSIYAVDSS